MRTINEHRIRQRVSGIWDTAQGTQGTSKSLKDYTKALQRQVDIHTETMGNADAFARDFGAGI